VPRHRATERRATSRLHHRLEEPGVQRRSQAEPSTCWSSRRRRARRRGRPHERYRRAEHGKAPRPQPRRTGLRSECRHSCSSEGGVKRGSSAECRRMFRLARPQPLLGTFGGGPRWGGSSLERREEALGEHSQRPWASSRTARSCGSRIRRRTRPRPSSRRAGRPSLERAGLRGPHGPRRRTHSPQSDVVATSPQRLRMTRARTRPTLAGDRRQVY
jgi:hypothetical protein